MSSAAKRVESSSLDKKRTIGCRAFSIVAAVERQSARTAGNHYDWQCLCAHSAGLRDTALLLRRTQCGSQLIVEFFSQADGLSHVMLSK